jgi:arsenate reductase
MNPTTIYPRLAQRIETWQGEFDLISGDRRQVLEQLAAYVKQQHLAKNPVSLHFICTHNSRRSIISQVWAAVAGTYFNIPGIHVYSGGTEVTAFNPRAVAALERVGFQIQFSGSENPIYEVSFASDIPAIHCFSKVYDDPVNPSGQFAAVMTCSDADANCPFIPGADKRISLPYEDPKIADDTPAEEERYDERVHQIGRELTFAFHFASKSIHHHE